MLRHAFAAFALSAAALAQGNPIIAIGETFRIRAENLQEDRTIVLSLPRGYEASQERYPVLYLLDGDANFTHTRGTVDFLARNGLMPNVIIVGIPSTQQRTRDLTPTVGKRPDGTRAGSGGGEVFLDFIEKTLIPHVEKHYRTQPFRILAGHSFGGLLAVHALATRPQLFQGILAASPSLEWDDDQPLRALEALFRTKPTLRVTLFASMANEEFGHPRPNRFDHPKDLLKRAKVEGTFAWETRPFPDEDHGSVLLRSHYWGLRKIFEGWRLPVDPQTRKFPGGLKELKTHYEKLTQRFGYPVVPPEAVVNAVGYEALARNNQSESVAILRYNVTLYPASPNAQDSLGEALERDGKKTEASVCYSLAVALAEKAKDPRLPIYLRNRDRLTQAEKR